MAGCVLGENCISRKDADLYKHLGWERGEHFLYRVKHNFIELCHEKMVLKLNILNCSLLSFVMNNRHT